MAAIEDHARSVFLAAVERAPGEWPAFLAEACGGDAELRARVERLLGAHESMGSIHVGLPADVATSAANASAPLRESAGTAIGNYRLLEQIGEGGMGVVFLAEQSHPVRRQVALKVIKAGMDTRQVVARFQSERQALALMDHPNIAKVFDAGATESGRPYFVMELVKGVPITRYCDEHRLTPRDRLGLFVQVCQAVQHAHTKGIIHRDLKPSNVLVALYDGKPVPKVIDFGVAKATGGRLAEATVFTGFGAVVGTPEYMSPEQAELNQLDIDTRSDVYSLGVILYELLTGSTPLQRKQLNAAALLEILRVVREQDPPKPSTRLSTTDQLATIAASRGLEPRKLGSMVRGELDWIVMKALEKDRDRRYETANGLAKDVQRYLADEPVQACPPSVWYRFRKFGRRNKVALLSVVTVVAALIAGTTVSTWQAVVATRATHDKEAALELAEANEQAARENAARADAEREAARESAKHADAERVRAETNFYKTRRAISDVVVNAAAGIGKWHSMPIEYRKIVVADAVKYYEGLIQTNSAEPAVRYETGFALGQIGLIHRTHGEHAQAEPFYRRSVEVLDALVRDYPKPAEYRQQCAYQHMMFAIPLNYLDRPGEREAHLRIAIDLYEQLLRETPGRLSLCDELSWTYNYLIGTIAPAPEAQTLYQKMADCAETACEPFLTKPLAPRPADQARREARALNDIASCLVKVPASLERDHRVVLRLGQAMTEVDPGFNYGWEVLAVGHTLAGDSDAAKAAFGESAARVDKAYAATPTAAELKAQLLGYAGLITWIDAKRDPGLRTTELVYREALKLASGAPADQRADPPVRRQIAHAHRYWAAALHTTNRLDEAEKVLSDALEIFDKLVTDDPGTAVNWHYAADTRAWIARLMIASGRELQGEQMAREAIRRHEMCQTKFPDFRGGDTDQEQSNSYNRLAWLLATSRLPQQRNPAEAVKLAAKAVEFAPAQSNCRTTLGIAYYRAGRWKESIEALMKSDELHTADNAVPFNGLFLAMAHWQLGDKAESRRCYDRAAAWIEENSVGDQRQADSLNGFHAEAAELLGVEGPYRQATVKLAQRAASPKRSSPPDARPTTAAIISEPAKWTVERLDATNIEAWKLRRDGKLEEAAALRHQVLIHAKQSLPSNDARMFKYLNGYAELLTVLGRYDEAEASYREAQANLDQQSNPAAADKASLAVGLNKFYKVSGRGPTTAPATATTRAASAAATEMLAWDRQSPEGVARAVQSALTADFANPSLSPFDRLVYGEHLILGGEPAGAVSSIRQAIDDAGKTGAVQPYFYKSLGWALLAAGDSEQAATAFSKAMGDESRWQAASPPADADIDQWTAAYLSSLVTQEQYTSHFSESAHASLPWFYVGQLLETQHNPDAAAHAYQEAVGLGTHHVRHWAAYRLQNLRQPASPK